MSDGPLKKRYDRKVEEREDYLRRARQAARYTIPSLMPEEGHAKSQVLYTPYQGLGQRGLNNLSSKLLMILMPPDTPMFKLDVDDFQLQQQLSEDVKAKGEMDIALNRIERAVTTDLASTDLRKNLGGSLKQLLVAGNVAIFQDNEGDARVWRLDQFVVQRAPSGQVLEVIIQEPVAPELLTEEQRIVCMCEKTAAGDGEFKPVDIYTQYKRVDKRWVLTQEINGHFVPGSERSWPLDKGPMIMPTTNRLPGENYGRGYIETVCLGDLISFEGLSKALLEAAAQSAKILWMRNPNSSVRAKDLEKPNGSVINGNPNDVGAMRLDKNNDMSFAQNQANGIEKRLEQVFMLNQSVQRKGERVTATEIQFVAQDIEDALGNLYTDLASGFQLPIVNFQMTRLARAKRIPQLPKGVIRPRITTGLSALGRGQDLRRLQGFTRDLVEFGGEGASQLLNESEFVDRLAAGHSIDKTGLIKSQEEIAEQQQAAQQAELQASVAPGVAKELAAAGGPALINQMTGQGTDS